jgi:SAM-dependent methyltransferase
MTNRQREQNSRPFNKLILGNTHFFSHTENKMLAEGNVIEARENFISKRFNNLDFLLKHRYEWMNEFLKNCEIIIEVGCGAGFSKLYLNKNIIMTDTIENEWVDRKLDATKLELEDNSIDAIIASHNIHHFSSPVKFFWECERVLKNNGFVIIQEINTSLLMRLLLKAMRHEGWSYQIDIFDENQTANDPKDPWSANCAIPELLFEQSNQFHIKFPSLKIIKNEKNEGFIFPLSGGVIAKTKLPELPTWFLKIVSFIDKILIKLFPNIFALGRSVVIQKIKS